MQLLPSTQIVDPCRPIFPANQCLPLRVFVVPRINLNRPVPFLEQHVNHKWHVPHDERE